MIDADVGAVRLDSGEWVHRGKGNETHTGASCDGRRVDVLATRDRIHLTIVDDAPRETAAAWLERHLGEPRDRYPRGAVWERPWGFIYARQLDVTIATRGHKQPIPSPTSTERDLVDFRCLACGQVTPLPYGRGVLDAYVDRGAAMCAHCDAASWVQAGSMTEFYRFSRRDDVCEVGKHPAASVTRYELRREPSSEELARARAAGHHVMTGLNIKCCPEHLPVLRAGFLGFTLSS